MRLRATVKIRNEAMLAARKKLGLSQNALDKKAGVPHGTAQRFEKLDYSIPKDETLLLDRAIKVSLILSVPVDDVLPDNCAGMRMESERSQVREFTHAELTDALSGVKLISAPVDEIVAANEQQERLASLLGEFQERTATAIKMRFGLDGYLPMTFEEIGIFFGISKSRASQLINRSIWRLKKMLKDRGLKYEDFFPEEP